MYAVVRTGGKQYRVAPGDILEVEKLAGDVGDSVVLDDVLMVSGADGVRIGRPNVEGASVTARITGQRRGEKILVFRYRPKKRVRVRRGHRQYLTRLQIHKISGKDFEFVAEAAEAAVAETDSIADADETSAADSVEDVAVADSAVAVVKETVEKAGDALDDTVDKASDAASDDKKEE